MSYAVGLDMLDIERIEKSIENQGFMSKVFSEGERHYIQSKGRRCAETAAGIFCAKEALSKALGIGLHRVLSSGYELRYDENGKPFFYVNDQRFTSDVSITHTTTTAAAVVVVW